MARAVYYTEDDDRKLLNVYEDNKKKKFIEVAKIAQRYGICKERGEQALAQHLSKLVNPPKADAEEEPEIAMQPEPEIAMLKKALSIAEGKYNGILHAVIGKATLYEGVSRNSLKLNFAEIMRWVWVNEPELANARIEELELEKKV